MMLYDVVLVMLANNAYIKLATHSLCLIRKLCYYTHDGDPRPKHHHSFFFPLLCSSFGVQYMAG